MVTAAGTRGIYSQDSPSPIRLAIGLGRALQRAMVCVSRLGAKPSEEGAVVTQPYGTGVPFPKH